MPFTDLIKSPKVDIFTFQPDGKTAEDSVLYPNGPINEINLFQALSVCFWFKLLYLVKQGVSQNTIFSGATKVDSNCLYIGVKGVLPLKNYETSPSYEIEIQHNVNGSIMFLDVDVTKSFKPNRWFHICYTYDQLNLINGEMKFYLNGELVNEAYPTNISSSNDPLWSSTTSIVIGQEQDSLNDTFQASQSFSGSLAMLAFYKRALTKFEAVSMFKHCNNGKLVQQGLVNSGSILDSFYSSIVTKSKVEADPKFVTCRSNNLENSLNWKFDVSHQVFDHVCHMLGGQLPIVSNQGQDMKDLIKSYKDGINGKMFYLVDKFAWILLNNVVTVQSSVLLGNQWNYDKQIWINPYTNEELTNMTMTFVSNWQNYSMLYRGQFHYVSFEDFYAEGLCLLETEENVFYLDGLCQSQEIGHFDNMYYVHGSRNNFPLFKGFTRSMIFYDDTTESWTIQSLQDPERKITLVRNVIQGSVSHPFGTNVWQVEKKVPICDLEKGQRIELTFSNCKAGWCIELSKRCDNRLDCDDMTDELNCSNIKVPDAYSAVLPPAGEDGGPLDLNLKVIIDKIAHIDTFNSKFSAAITIEMAWIDSRLHMDNLHLVQGINQLSLEDMNSLWMPYLVFKNALSAVQTQVDDQTTGQIIQKGHGSHSPSTYSQRAYHYSGNENMIVIRRSYFQEFICDFKLQNYPFDTQVCSIELEQLRETANFVRFKKVDVVFKDSNETVEYIIQKTTTRKSISDRVHSYAQVMIVVGRQIEYHITNTMGQTFLLLSIGYLTMFFDVGNFTDRIMVTLTTMLVIATITTSVQGDLPKTSYFKMLDIWLWFCMNSLVFILLIHTFIAYKQKSASNKVNASPSKKNNELNRLNRLFQIGVLAGIIGFNVYFWTNAFRQFNSGKD